MGDHLGKLGVVSFFPFFLFSVLSAAASKSYILGAFFAKPARARNGFQSLNPAMGLARAQAQHSQPVLKKLVHPSFIHAKNHILDC